MLKKIICDKFIENEIVFHNGLNPLFKNLFKIEKNENFVRISLKNL